MILVLLQLYRRSNTIDVNNSNIGKSADLIFVFLLTEPITVRRLAYLTRKARSVTLTWERPNTRCLNTHYNISYRGAPPWGHQPRVGSEQAPLWHDNDTLTFELKNLLPHSNYSIQVLAETEEPNGTWATLQVITSKEGWAFKNNFCWLIKKLYSYLILHIHWKKIAIFSCLPFSVCVNIIHLKVLSIVWIESTTNTRPCVVAYTIL